MKRPTWRDNHNEEVPHVVLNRFASAGLAGPKRWFRELLLTITRRLLTPQIEALTMHRDETICFDQVAVSLPETM